MKSVRYRVRRIEVHLANDAAMPKLHRPLQQMGVEQAAHTTASMLLGNDNPINIQKFVEPIAKPKEVTTVVTVGLLKCQ
ncbi:hypothetical protein AXW67_17005 [Bradyrhizobium neotropicale]|uniref:Uncharacterized protein n=1 Tax=Bradyrhizobium neotropicale TaxID=1497615 RepID=A0A176Z3T6_9BRAD|nr:hypothetical protein AXW67_17005 [Bradyrhizobium neotropicale]